MRGAKAWHGGGAATDSGSSPRAAYPSRAPHASPSCLVLLGLTRDLDLSRLRGLRLRHAHCEQAVLELRGDVLTIDKLGQLDRALERAAHPLRGVNAELGTVGGLDLRVLRAADRQHVLLEVHVDL